MQAATAPIPATTPAASAPNSTPEDDQFPPELESLTSAELETRSRLLENDLRVMKSEIIRLQHEQASMAEQLADNLEKIKLNKQLPYLVANVVELLEVEDEEEGDEDDDEDENEHDAEVAQGRKGTRVGNDATRSNAKAAAKKKKMTKCAVVKTTTRTVRTGCQLSNHEFNGNFLFSLHCIAILYYAMHSFVLLCFAILYLCLSLLCFLITHPLIIDRLHFCLWSGWLMRIN